MRAAFFIPALLLLLILVAWPVGWSVWLSFQTEAGIGLANYEEVVTSTDTVNLAGFPDSPPWGTLLHNAVWIAIHLPLTLFLGLWLALMLREVKGASVVKSAIFLGMVTPMIVGGIIIGFLLRGGSGIVPAFFSAIGVNALAVDWVQHPQTILFGFIFGSAWLWVGFSLIVYSAGLTTIPDEFFEAARVDGASTWRMFTKVTLPLLKPMTLTIVTMTILWELKIFDIVFAITGHTGGVARAADVMALQMYRYAFIFGDVGLGAAVATILTLLTFVAAVWTIRYMVKS